MKTTLAIATLLLSGCTEHLKSPTAGSVTTLNVTLLSPDPGSPGNPNTVQKATVNIDALTDDGTNLPVDLQADVYLSYGGVLAGAASGCGNTDKSPIETVTLHNGHLENEVLTLPDAFGQSSIWVEEQISHVVGASTPIFFANPTISDIQTPVDPTAVNATYCSAFDKKFVTVDHATGGGDLLVDSVFNGAVVAVDTGVPTTATSGGYNAVYIFTFGAPATDVVHGAKLTGFTGNVSKFNGFTEVNFPQMTVDDTYIPDPSKLPPPIVLTSIDTGRTEYLNSINARTVITSGKICPMQPANPNNDPNVANTITQWIKYNTFLIGTTTCDSFSDFAIELPSKILGTFDPTTLVGKDLTVRGMLKNSSGQTTIVDGTGVPVACSDVQACKTGTCLNGVCKKNPYNFWTITVRDASDINPQ